jgi:hypothetical protein
MLSLTIYGAGPRTEPTPQKKKRKKEKKRYTE